MSAALDRKLREAGAALAAGDLPRAERLSREVLDRAPRHPRALALAASVRLEQGDGVGAGELLRRALAGDPDNPRLLEGLGAAALRAGDGAEAETWLRRAIALGKGGGAPALSWLGLALSAQGRRAEAIETFRQAVSAGPDDPGAHLNLGHELMRDGRRGEAIAAYERALELNPRYAEAWDGLGDGLLGEGRYADAEAAFRQAVALAPHHADYPAGLAHALAGQQRWREALAQYERALALRPDDPEALNSMGTVLLESGEPEAALAPIQRAIAMRPDYAAAHENRGTALLRLGREEEASDCFREAIRLDPGEAERHLKLGGALMAQQLWEGALAEYERALALQPGNAQARYERALVRLYCHDFERAWPEYERRFATGDFRRNSFRRTASSVELFERLRPWRGADDAGAGAVAIWAEQGIGDHVLFSTLIPELVATGVPFLYELEDRLVGAYQRAFPGARFVPRAEPPRAELQRASRVLAAGSLPGFFRKSRADFARQPAKLLSALPGRVAHYRARLDALGPGLKVALSWRSSRKDWLAARKSVPLAQFAPVLQLPGARFLDVQYGDTAAERGAVEAAAGARLARFEEVDYLNDLEEVFAILEASDLVITTSNATAHFAGALGKRTWLIFPADRAPFHYWAHGGTYRCLWYPSVEIVTGPQFRNWPELIEHVGERLGREWDRS
jgi:tetratricopeptide (TPR) repeat protein